MSHLVLLLEFNHHAVYPRGTMFDSQFLHVEAKGRTAPDGPEQGEAVVPCGQAGDVIEQCLRLGVQNAATVRERTSALFRNNGRIMLNSRVVGRGGARQEGGRSIPVRSVALAGWNWTSQPHLSIYQQHAREIYAGGTEPEKVPFH